MRLSSDELWNDKGPNGVLFSFGGVGRCGACMLDEPHAPIVYAHEQGLERAINDTGVIFLDDGMGMPYGAKIQTDILSERRYVSRKDTLYGWEASCLLAVADIEGRNTDGIT